MTVASGKNLTLDLNGRLGFFSYERMSFAINSVTANGIKVNTSSDDVSSTIGASDASISFRMDKPDSRAVASAFGEEEVTLTQVRKMIADGSMADKAVTDKYGAVLTETAIGNIAESFDGKNNQAFSHSDEEGMYHYTLRMQIDNPVNISESDSRKIEKFVIDFTYNGSEHYELDMSRDKSGSRSMNPAFADLFCRPDDKETTAEMNVWVPGRVSNIKVTLKMSGGDRLSVTFADVLLGGLKVYRKTDYVSSVIMTSEAEIECTVPDSLINLSKLSEERLSEVLEAIYGSDEKADLSDVKDQLGAVIGKAQLKAAHDDMMKCIGASGTDTRAEFADVIPGFYMYKTVYRAENISALQTFIEEKRIEVQKKAAA